MHAVEGLDWVKESEAHRDLNLPWATWQHTDYPVRKVRYDECENVNRLYIEMCDCLPMHKRRGMPFLICSWFEKLHIDATGSSSWNYGSAMAVSAAPQSADVMLCFRSAPKFVIQCFGASKPANNSHPRHNINIVQSVTDTYISIQYLFKKKTQYSTNILATWI